MITSSYQFPIITKEMYAQIQQWHKSHNGGKCSEYYQGAIGGDISFEITPTSIGDFITVRCSCGELLSIECL